jgi:NAD(P)-dependent dehydrogenase (short-subunit alcohol dehydrogenase family)
MSKPEQLFDLTGKTALVTGASSGLGRHFAACLASAGASVVVAARRMDLLESLVQELTAKGGKAVAARLDVTDAASVKAALDVCEAKFGGIDVLVNNSGVIAAGSVLDQSEAEWDFVLDTNLKGCFLVAAEAGRRMRAAEAGRPGSIINIASILGLRQAAQVAAYSASKAALIQLTKSMALELARYGIRVNAIAPGYIETDLNRDFFATPPGEALIKRIPQRQLGQPQDLDGALLLLASGASRYMTGAVIEVDGGHLVSSL